MNPLVESFGVRFMPGRLVKKSEHFQPDFIVATPTKEAGEFSYIFNQMIRREYVVTMPGTTGLECFEDKGFSITPLFVSDTIGSWNELETVDFLDDTVSLILWSEKLNVRILRLWQCLVRWEGKNSALSSWGCGLPE